MREYVVLEGEERLWVAIGLNNVCAPEVMEIILPHLWQIRKIMTGLKEGVPELNGWLEEMARTDGSKQLFS